jgi:hypothetical protein
MVTDLVVNSLIQRGKVRNRLLVNYTFYRTMMVNESSSRTRQVMQQEL